MSCARDNTDKDVFNLKLYQCPLDWYLTFPRALEGLDGLNFIVRGPGRPDNNLSLVYTRLCTVFDLITAPASV